ncbi:protein neuralized-like isoform X1 [Daphnia pulex]|uniref:protein neuralized-like isoform X1 n=1 Tax=Daphnia pulex TaxID=6669 RepID=UPI001EDFDADB|nr:protein neuralized-like isoform X1 [Daphnia pulex]
MVTELITSDSGKTKSSPKSLKGAMKVIKKLKGRIGLGSNNGDGSASQPVLQFHNTRGEHVRLSADRSTARRVDSFCKGIAFSQRTVRPNEKVYLRVAECSTSWNGVLRIGFTSCNPASFSGVLPKYACPDLTSRPGFWGKALPERYVESGVLFSFHFTASGDVMLNVNGQDKGVFLTGVDARTPLWIMVDIYGNTTAVQFVDPRGSLNNNPMRNSPTRRSTTSLHSSASSSGISGTLAANDMNQRPHHLAHQQMHHQQQMPRPRSEADLLVSMNALNLNRGPHQIPSLPLPPIPGSAGHHHLQQQLQTNNTIQPPAPPAVLQNFPPPPPLRHYRHHSFQPLTFHPRTHGVNIRMGSDCRTAVRHDAEFCNGYVLSSRPISPGESWVVQIVQTESIYVGGMGFGFTTCNPASLSSTDLPDDADQLLDRPEYWVISKDVAHGPILGDEIEFHLSHSGEVTMMRNRGSATLLMHVDVSLPLWAIFDVYGSTRAVRLLGTISPPQSVPEPPAVIYQAPPRMSPPRPQQQQQQPIYQSIGSAAHMMQPTIPAGVLSSGTASSYVETLTQSLNCQTASGGASSECTVCYERSVDCVLYSCGHMCLCYDCALTLYHGGRTAGGQGLCPICRAPIRDVIRAYRS